MPNLIDQSAAVQALDENADMATIVAAMTDAELVEARRRALELAEHVVVEAAVRGVDAGVWRL